VATAVVGIRPEQIRDAARRVAAARQLATIEEELEATMTRRTELWRAQSLASDPRVAAEVKALSEQINRLWAESRARRACIRAGSRERILSRVRAEARFERDAKQVQGGAR